MFHEYKLKNNYQETKEILEELNYWITAPQRLEFRLSYLEHHTKFCFDNKLNDEGDLHNKELERLNLFKNMIEKINQSCVFNFNKNLGGKND